MAVGGLVAAVLGVDAENKSLEDVALPLGGASRPTAGDTYPSDLGRTARSQRAAKE